MKPIRLQHKNSNDSIIINLYMFYNFRSAAPLRLRPLHAYGRIWLWRSWIAVATRSAVAVGPAANLNQGLELASDNMPADYHFHFRLPPHADVAAFSTYFFSSRTMTVLGCFRHYRKVLHIIIICIGARYNGKGRLDGRARNNNWNLTSIPQCVWGRE